MRKKKLLLWSLALLLAMAFGPFGAAAEEADDAGDASAALSANSASDIAAQLGILLGDGQGVTETYLAKTTTRMQGAILTMRLLGKEKEALAFGGNDNFADAESVGSSIRPVLAYLKQHPELGWSGTGDGKFSPNDPITAQQVYKVMLESLSYRTGTDFAYADTLTFAASKGLYRAAAADPFTNRDLAVALTETLQAIPQGGTMRLVEKLAADGAVQADKAALLDGSRIDISMSSDGTAYLTDGNGMTLYLFTKDTADLNACTGDCLKAWPIFDADSLILADGLAAADFGAFIRADGEKQVTYKGWPLYYWMNDKEPGDTTGDGVNKVWYKINQPFYTIALGTDPNLNINYLVDGSGMSLYYFDKDPEGASVCAGNCLANWPVFHAENISVPSSLDAEDFGEIIRPDGAKQMTFKGYPLYYWFQDMNRGDVNGHDVGGVWFLVDPEKFADTTAQQSLPGNVTIEMKNYAFSAAETTVKAGSTITFVNLDNDFHNAVAVDESFRIPLISQGQSVTIVLDKPGTYEYYCEPHSPHMRGTIIVQ